VSEEGVGEATGRDGHTPSCARCARPLCHFNIMEGVPVFCPNVNRPDELSTAREALESDDGTKAIAREASRVEGAGYGRWTRVREVMEFARRLGVEKIGIAFCVGLRREARTFCEILESNGFEVVSVCCKVGSRPKEELGLDDSEKVIPGSYESYCNPVAQALILDGEGCGLNVLVGLCVGHDSLFFRHTRTPTTVLVAKDRVTGHNPAAVLHTADSYYSGLKNIEE